MYICPLISVVIPAYNAAELIGETIESVIRQSFPDWELIVVDDGSTDNTVSVVEDFCTKDSRIRLISQPNSGVSIARNSGAEKAKGELISFLDSDDMWLEDKLIVHVDYMQRHPKAGISYALVEAISPEGCPSGKVANNHLSCEDPHYLFYKNPTITPSNIVVRRKLFLKLGGFDESLVYTEDKEILFRLLCNSEFTVEQIDKILVRYRVHGSSSSSHLSKIEKGWRQFMEKARDLVPEMVDKHYSSAYASQLLFTQLFQHPL
ncbi:MAG: glycosyltransferase [Cyanobacteria bacterium J06635_13]